MKKIGIDIGGTFTDLILQDEKDISIFKVPSTPADPAKAALMGLREIIGNANINPTEIDLVAHGTTISTNAVIERKGAKPALITTKGFRDVIEIGRLGRPPEAIYDIQYEKPEPLVPRHLRFEVDERVNCQGKIVQKLEEGNLKFILQKVKEEKINSIAVCLLFSYLFPDHERRLKDLINNTLPDIHVVLSSDILPEFREYERTSATVINAYLGPVIGTYLERMRDELQKDALSKKFYIMQSNGGLTTPEVCLEKPSTTILSGPAAGIVGAAYLAELAGFDHIISVDMGGTSFDVSLVRNGQPITSTTKKILESPLGIPMIDIQTIGAGGGSIAWIDQGGILRVGPQSAGAYPGPACYGLDGEEPTVTDANMVLGFLNPSYFLGGRIGIFVDKAIDAIRSKIADKLGISPVEAAEGIYRIVNAHMSGATRVVSVEKGYDPRDFALIAFGGAGPVHAAEIAKELEIPWTIVPKYPGVTSAYGLVVAELIHDYVQTFFIDMKRLALNKISEAYESLEQSGNEDLSKDRIRPENRKFIRSADMRYSGQVYTLNVEVPDGKLNDKDIEEIMHRFNDAHESIYGFKVEGEPIEIVNLRVKAMGIIKKMEPKKDRGKKISLDNALKERRNVYFREKGFIDTPVFDREKILPGNVIQGPCIIEQIDSTIVIPPDFFGTVDGYFNVIMGNREWKGGKFNHENLS